MTARLIRTALTIGCLLLAFTRAASADDPDERTAKRHYERGQKLFGLQKFDQALEQFQQAFDAKPIPAFLFNIGQCHRNLGDYGAAVFSFKRFLKLSPDAENREQVEELIQELEQKQAEGDTERLRLGKRPPEEDAEDEPAPTESEGKPVYKKWWFWTGIAVVTAGAGVGIYFATKSSGPPGTDLGHIDYPR